MKKKSYEIRLKAQFGNEKDKKELAAYRRRRKERMLEASNKDWMIQGKARNRYWVMENIVSRVAAGESLPSICRSEEYPSIQQVYAWFKCHPDFEKVYREAEEVRGHLLGEQALEIALTTDRENVAADKLKIETLSKFAARANNRFQDKAVQQNIDEYSTMTSEQIKQRIKALLAANPELTTSTPGSLQDAQGTALPSLASAPIEADLVECDMTSGDD